jgi:hypothetical protein
MVRGRLCPDRVRQGSRAEQSSSRFGHCPRGQALTLQELLNQRKKADENEKNCILWKFGRSSHFTFGEFSHILSNYRAQTGVVTDELVILGQAMTGPNAKYNY